jgi:iron(III) transport system substrate-binding protein
VTQESVDAVIEGFEAGHDAAVEVFRAPTGELNARIAAERREGRVQADVFWLSDPLSMQQFDAEGLLRHWTPANLGVVPPEVRSERFFGTRLLNIVVVVRDDLEPTPASWWDLADETYADAVAMPDPGLAGPAIGGLGYIALLHVVDTTTLSLEPRGGSSVALPWSAPRLSAACGSMTA